MRLSKILTASHSNKPSLTDEQVSKGFLMIDITAKSGCDIGWVLAPSWDIVSRYKSGNLTQENFKKEYFDLIESRWKKPLKSIEDIENVERIILVCYCPPNQFCHRYLAADFLVRRYHAQYCGEYALIRKHP